MAVAEQQRGQTNAFVRTIDRSSETHAERAANHITGAGKPRRRVGLIAVLMIGGGLALVAGGDCAWNWWTHGRFVQSTDDAYLEADQVSVSARISGLVDQVLVSDNQTVAAGQPLVRIDDRDPRARLAQATAQADQATASIAEANAEIAQQDAVIEQAKAALAGAQSQVALAKRQAERSAELLAKGAGTQATDDERRQSLAQMLAMVAQDAASLLAAQRQIASLQAKIQGAKAQIEQAHAQGRQAQVDLDATLVKAAIDGRVGDKSVQTGQYLQTGTRMMTLVPVPRLYLVANFKETQISDMRAGQPATISVDALGGRKLSGRVDSFAPGTGSEFALIPPQNATGNFTKIVQRVSVRIALDADADANAILVPGLSATAAVDTASVANQSGDSDPRARAADTMLVGRQTQ